MKSIKTLLGAVAFPLIGYRPQRVAPETWDREYRDGQWGYLAGMDSLAGFASILGYCQFLAPAAILDVGCGEGLLAQKLKVLPYRSYLGIDLSPAAVDLAQKLGDERTRFAVADAHRFESDERFDTIIFNQSLYYLADPAAIMTRYRAMLNPGGRLIISMTASPRTKAAWPLIGRMLREEDAMVIWQAGGKVTTKVFAPL